MCKPERSADVAWLAQLAAMAVAVTAVAWFVIVNAVVLGLGLVAVVVVTAAWIRFLYSRTVRMGSARLRPVVAASAARAIQPPVALPVRERAAIVAARSPVLQGIVLSERQEVRR